MFDARPNPDIELAKAVAEYYDDPLGFVLFAFPWGQPGTPLASIKGPRRWQWEFLEWLGEEIRGRGFDGVEAVEPIPDNWISGRAASLFIRGEEMGVVSGMGIP